MTAYASDGAGEERRGAPGCECALCPLCGVAPKSPPGKSCCTRNISTRTAILLSLHAVISSANRNTKNFGRDGHKLRPGR
jgi:hypothetical protein